MKKYENFKNEPLTITTFLKQESSNNEILIIHQNISPTASVRQAHFIITSLSDTLYAGKHKRKKPVLENSQKIPLPDKNPLRKHVPDLLFRQENPELTLRHQYVNPTSSYKGHYPEN